MNRLVGLFICVTVVCMFNYDKIESFFFNIKHDILRNTNRMLLSKTHDTKHKLIDLHNVIQKESIDYNNQHCNHYSKFYKLNYDRAFIDKQKTYVVPETYKQGGVYSVEERTCVHPDDPLFTPHLDCNTRIICASGITVPGKEVLRNNTKACVYDCV